MIGVEEVAPLDGYRLRAGFSDGTERVIDFVRSVRRFLTQAGVES